MTETTASPQTKKPAMVTAYLVLAIVTTATIGVQFFLAGLGAFHDYRTKNTSWFEAHQVVGVVIVALSLLMLLTAILARMGGRTVGMVAVLLVLAGPLQALLAMGGTDHGEVWGALHALNGALILGYCSTLIRIARRR